MRELERAIEKIGGIVYAESREGIKKGKAVVFPARYEQRQWGTAEHLPQGRCDVKRYLMFCGKGLLEFSDYGNRVYSGNDSYVLIWKDETQFRGNSFYKACLRKITEE